MLLLGAHFSVAGGVHRAVETASALKCNCLQVFVKNQRQWQASPLTTEQVDAWFDTLAKAKPKIRHVIAHSAYLINLASDQASVRRKSVAALREELGRCRQLRIDRLVLHPGSHRGQGVEVGKALIVDGLESALADSDEAVMVLLETTSGSKNSVGHRLEDLADIIGRCKFSDRLGCCLDSCHLFAAGFPLSPKREFDRLIRRIDAIIGCDRIGCIHLNDSKGEFGSGLDRHEHIGRGKIGRAAFQYFLRSSKLTAVPKIIETPKGPADRLDYDRRNLRLLRRLAAKSS